MYKIFNISGVQIRNCSQLSIRNLSQNPDLSLTQKACLLCKHLNIHSRVQIRRESTVTYTNTDNPRKYKRKKQTRKYADILVVTDKSLSHKKATIRKLSSSDIKLLTSTNLNLNELYKLKDYSNKGSFSGEHTYNPLTILETGTITTNFEDNSVDVDPDCKITVSVPEVSSSIPVFLSSNADVELNNDLLEAEPEESIKIAIENGDIECIRVENSLQPENLEHIENDDVLEGSTSKAGQNKKETVKKKIHKERVTEIAERSLAAYIEVCNNLKNPQRGLNAVYFHRRKSKKTKGNSFLSLKSVNVYNTLLRGFGNAGNLPKVKEVLKMMSEESVQLNVQSYVAIFDCLGRCNESSHRKDIRKYVKHALKQGITFDRMLNEGIFLDKERDMVLIAIGLYDEHYVAKYFDPKVQYDNPLLNILNCGEQLQPSIDKTFVDNGGLFTPEDLNDRLSKQMKLEENGYVTVKSIEARDTPTEEVRKFRETLEQHYKMWEDSAFEAFNRDLATLCAKRYVLNIEPYIRAVPVKDIVKITIDEAKKVAQGSETYSPTVTQLHRDLGNKVYARYKVLRKQKTGVLEKVTTIHSKYCERYAANHDKLDFLPTEEVYMNPRQEWQWVAHSFQNSGPSLELGHQNWTPTILQTIGKMLYHIVMHDLKVDVNSLRHNQKHNNYLPAFYTIFRTQGNQAKEEVKPHPVLSRLYRASVPETLTFPAYEVPMVCPPVPWVSTTIGGYLISPCDVVRLPPSATCQKNRMADCDPVHLYPSLDALNQLASVPWKVNRKILDVILEVFNKGGSAKLDVPEPPSSLPYPDSMTPDMEKAERYQIFRQRLQYRRKKAEMYSLWCDCLYRLSLANHFKDEIFWLPHNMDFRGRVYPIPPHLNHLGSDLARSMLVFAEARPLGPKGLDWLKIHLINLTGLKKRDPVAERLKFANEIMPLILDSADQPLTGRKWWAESEEPWQTLACCMEIADVVRSGDHVNYRSHFPVHQDGSCNGLQHYAALGRDSAGAYSVNLVPSEEPQDVYSAVVALVEERRAKDAANGLEIAKVLEGFVKRKVIKQTIMTTVYGVTRFGARLQIVKQLKDIDDFPKEFVWSASSYLTSQTFESLRTMFTSTREIQDWFTECARLISSIGNQYVEWVTPLGLPIVQPYFKSRKVTAGTVYENFHIDKFEKPNVMKQKNAFPPNFIHSLDSSHMMLTSLNCERAGITFVSVHDCYWTHPSTVHIMNKICREQFVALHSQPILEDLSVFLTHRYSHEETDFFCDGIGTRRKLNKILRKLPKTGDFDIRKVLNSVYFFS